MTEAKQKIAHIVGDYMDKTLSEGCLIRFKNTIEYYYGDDSIFVGRPIYEILGHYDITAVLKFIESKIGMKRYKIYWDSIVLEERVAPNIGRYIKILNKPLHLYTDQEDQTLLELFSKLI